MPDRNSDSLTFEVREALGKEDVQKKIKEARKELKLFCVKKWVKDRIKLAKDPLKDLIFHIGLPQPAVMDDGSIIWLKPMEKRSWKLQNRLSIGYLVEKIKGKKKEKEREEWKREREKEEEEKKRLYQSTPWTENPRRMWTFLNAPPPNIPEIRRLCEEVLPSGPFEKMVRLLERERLWVYGIDDLKDLIDRPLEEIPIEKIKKKIREETEWIKDKESSCFLKKYEKNEELTPERIISAPHPMDFFEFCRKHNAALSGQIGDLFEVPFFKNHLIQKHPELRQYYNEGDKHFHDKDGYMSTYPTACVYRDSLGYRRYLSDGFFEGVKWAVSLHWGKGYIGERMLKEKFTEFDISLILKNLSLIEKKLLEESKSYRIFREVRRRILSTSTAEKELEIIKRNIKWFEELEKSEKDTSGKKPGSGYKRYRKAVKRWFKEGLERETHKLADERAVEITAELLGGKTERVVELKKIEDFGSPQQVISSYLDRLIEDTERLPDDFFKRIPVHFYRWHDRGNMPVSSSMFAAALGAHRKLREMKETPLQEELSQWKTWPLCGLSDKNTLLIKEMKIPYGRIVLPVNMNNLQELCDRLLVRIHSKEEAIDYLKELKRNVEMGVKGYRCCAQTDSAGIPLLIQDPLLVEYSKSIVEYCSEKWKVESFDLSRVVYREKEKIKAVLKDIEKLKSKKRISGDSTLKAFADECCLFADEFSQFLEAAAWGVANRFHFFFRDDKKANKRPEEISLDVYKYVDILAQKGEAADRISHADSYVLTIADTGEFYMDYFLRAKIFVNVACRSWKILFWNTRWDDGWKQKDEKLIKRRIYEHSAWDGKWYWRVDFDKQPVSWKFNPFFCRWWNYIATHTYLESFSLDFLLRMACMTAGPPAGVPFESVVWENGPLSVYGKSFNDGSVFLHFALFDHMKQRFSKLFALSNRVVQRIERLKAAASLVKHGGLASASDEIRSLVQRLEPFLEFAEEVLVPFRNGMKELSGITTKGAFYRADFMGYHIAEAKETDKSSDPLIHRGILKEELRYGLNWHRIEHPFMSTLKKIVVDKYIELLKAVFLGTQMGTYHPARITFEGWNNGWVPANFKRLFMPELKIPLNPLEKVKKVLALPEMEYLRKNHADLVDRVVRSYFGVWDGINRERKGSGDSNYDRNYASTLTRMHFHASGESEDEDVRWLMFWLDGINVRSRCYLLYYADWLFPQNRGLIEPKVYDFTGLEASVHDVLLFNMQKRGGRKSLLDVGGRDRLLLVYPDGVEIPLLPHTMVEKWDKSLVLYDPDKKTEEGIRIFDPVPVGGWLKWEDMKKMGFEDLADPRSWFDGRADGMLRKLRLSAPDLKAGSGDQRARKILRALVFNEITRHVFFRYKMWQVSDLPHPRFLLGRAEKLPVLDIGIEDKKRKEKDKDRGKVIEKITGLFKKKGKEKAASASVKGGKTEVQKQVQDSAGEDQSSSSAEKSSGVKAGVSGSSM